MNTPRSSTTSRDSTRASTSPPREAGVGSLSARVLVVDDDPTVREVLGRMLVHHGHQVRLAATGPAALKILAEDPIDVVLSDVTMSPMNGFQLAERVRERWPQMAFVLVTGWDSESIEAEAPSVDYVLTKPATLQSTGDAVTRALAARQR